MILPSLVAQHLLPVNLMRQLVAYCLVRALALVFDTHKLPQAFVEGGKV